MNIGFNARTLSTSQLRGWSRYTRNIVRELSALGVSINLYSDRALSDEHLEKFDSTKVRVIVHKGLSYLDWEQRVLANLCQKNKSHILHCPINYGLPYKNSIPQVLTLHDAIDIAFPSKSKSLSSLVSWRKYYVKGLQWFSRNSADKIITVSHHAKSDLIRHFKIDSDKIQVIYEAADPHIISTQSTEPHSILKQLNGKKFFFYVGGFEERKNIPLLLQSFVDLQREDVALVLAGGGSQVEINKWIHNNGAQGSIFLPGWLSDKELSEFYKQALAFVYPSFYEGFGLQLTEAMSYGCPILSANQTSLPEVLGSAKGLFSPHSTSELKALMTKTIEDPTFTEELKNWSISRSQFFNWKKTAKETLAVYESLLTNRTV